MTEEVDVDTTPAPMAVRSPAESYALFAIVFAVVGIVIPVLPAAAALMLVRAVENDEETPPRTKSMANAAATVAYGALAFQAALCLIVLVGVFFEIVA